jgi:hypothetical protein
MAQPYPPNQRQHSQQQPQYQPYAQQQPYEPYHQQQAPRPQVIVRKRRIWPWILLTIVLVPVILFAGCTALLGAGVKAVDDARQGGTVGLGETFTYQSGLALSASIPKPYQSDNQFEIGRGEVGYEATITITNGTDKPVGAALITKNATVNGQPAQEIFGAGTLATQDIAPGQSLKLPFRFKTEAGAKGPLQIAVTDTFNEPVFFNGNIK